MKRLFLRSAILMFIVTVAFAAVSVRSAVFAQQASITLKNCDTGLCNTRTHEWALVKSSSLETITGSGPVTWTISATENPNGTPTQFITVNGVVTVENTGSANATIGNIVVNLQKPNSNKIGKKLTPWVSVAADCANSFSGDAATQCNIAAAGSQEDQTANATYGAINYVVTPMTTGAQGTFTETAGSGSLNFTDASNNTVWAISPQQTIAPGGSVTLLYTATFNNTFLNLADGQSVRTEALVTFGNAGPRGGSGASSQNIDIDGNGTVNTTDEAWVRTVPCRASKSIPALVECNDCVTLTDTSDNVTTSGSVSYSNLVTTVGGGSGTEQICDTASHTMTVDVVNNGTETGFITDCANLFNGTSFISVTVGSSTYNFTCCGGIDVDACKTVTVFPPEEGGGGGGGGGGGFGCGSYTTYSQGGYGQDWNCRMTGTGQNRRCSGVYDPPNGGPGSLLASNFASVYGSPGTITVGGAYTMKFGSAKAVADYLPATTAPGSLTASLVNPTSSSSGAFGGQVLTMQINVDFSNASVLPAGLGSLYYCNTGDALSGLTISQIVAAANTALGGGSLPSSYTYSSFTDLLDNLVHAFHPSDGGGCVVSDWATEHLSTTTTCPIAP